MIDRAAAFALYTMDSPGEQEGGHEGGVSEPPPSARTRLLFPPPIAALVDIDVLQLPAPDTDFGSAAAAGAAAGGLLWDDHQTAELIGHESRDGREEEEEAAARADFERRNFWELGDGDCDCGEDGPLPLLSSDSTSRPSSRAESSSARSSRHHSPSPIALDNANDTRDIPAHEARKILHSSNFLVNVYYF